MRQVVSYLGGIRMRHAPYMVAPSACFAFARIVEKKGERPSDRSPCWRLRGAGRSLGQRHLAFFDELTGAELVDVHAAGQAGPGEFDLVVARRPPTVD